MIDERFVECNAREFPFKSHIWIKAGVPPVSGHLTSRARWARKDGVQRAKTRPAYPPEFRREAVQMLRNWRRQAEADRRERTDVPTSAELEELRALRRENARLKQERDLLTRSATFFAAEGNERR